jgi:hypothetical protein
MLYKILADLVVLIHFLWILFLLFGAFPGVRYKAIKILHVSGLVFAFVIQVFGWYCPLTHLEVWLRAKHDPSLAYAGSFIIHYVEGLIYLEISAQLIFSLTLLLIGFNIWFYLGRGVKA